MRHAEGIMVIINVCINRGSNPGESMTSSPHPSRPPMGPTQHLVRWYWNAFPEAKRPWHGVDHPTPSTAKVQNEYTIFILPLFTSSWCYAVTFT